MLLTQLGSLTLLFAVAGTLPAVSARNEARNYRTLSAAQIEAIAKLDPPEWESVTGGHLEHLLVPRVCELILEQTRDENT
jgi:hypothetical protein